MGREGATAVHFRQARFLVSATNPKGYPEHARIEVALAGRSNVGKSSLINALTGIRGLARRRQATGPDADDQLLRVDGRLVSGGLAGIRLCRGPRAREGGLGSDDRGVPLYPCTIAGRHPAR